MRSAPVNMEQVAKLLTSSGPCLLFLRSAEDKQRPRCEEQGAAQPQQPSPSSPAQQPSRLETYHFNVTLDKHPDGGPYDLLLRLGMFLWPARI